MIFRNFLAWTQTAPAASRAEGASALARAYLQVELSDEDRADAELAMTALLDDSSCDVRRALAVELACSPNAPRHVITALAADQSEVSIPVLARSPLLDAAELCDCAVIADVYAQAAIALRPHLPAAAAAVIARQGAREAAISLAVNFSANLDESTLRCLIERFADDGEVREAMLSREDLPASIRADLVSATADALASFATACGWLKAERAERVARESRDSGLIEIAADSPVDSDRAGLVAHLRAGAQLTPSLLLRALLSGNRSLFESALQDLTGLPEAKIAGLVAGWNGPGFAAIYGRAGLPATLLPVFRAALAAQDEYGLVYGAGRRPQLSRVLIDRTLRLTTAQADLGRVTSLLHRLRAEAVRAEARALSSDLLNAGLAPQLGPAFAPTLAPAGGVPVENTQLTVSAPVLADDLADAPEPIAVAA